MTTLLREKIFPFIKGDAFTEQKPSHLPKPYPRAPGQFLLPRGLFLNAIFMPIRRGTMVE